MNFFAIFFGILAIATAQSTTGRYDFQQNDINTLNYALTLENLEYNFYRTGLQNFSAQNFMDAGYNSSVYDYFTLIMNHEMSHVSTLTMAIQARGGVAVGECVYNFGYSTVPQFVAVAQTLENTGVSAYDGAINTLTELGLQVAAATIATVEARHAAFLNELNGVSPFPAAFDTPLTPSQVIDTVKSTFIVSCDATSSALLIVPSPAVFTLNNATNMTAEDINDVHTFQFALTLEALEYSFFSSGISKFNASDFLSAGYNQSVYDNVVMVTNFEGAHVGFLNTTLASLGNYTLPYCTYNFTSHLVDVETFIATGALFQNTGEFAFNGAIDTISNLVYRQAAATIATVEGRFAAYFNQLVGTAPFPNIFDPYYTPQQAYAIASPFILSCPYDPTSVFPVPANFSEAAQISGSVAVSSTSPSTTASMTTGSSATSGAATTGAASTTVGTSGRATTGRSSTSNQDSSASIVASSIFVAMLALLL